MPDNVKIWPVAMTKRGGILGNRSNKIPAYVTSEIDGTAIVAAAAADGMTFTAKEYPCATFYVNSKSGGSSLTGPTETGAGTRENPWVNLNTVFSSDLFSCLIENYCCLFVKVIVSGTLDYYLDGNGKNFSNRLILDFHSALIINWNKDKHGLSMTIVKNVSGVNFNNFAFTTAISFSKTDSDGQVDIYTYCFSSCANCVFYNNTGEIHMKNNVSGTGAKDHTALYVEYFSGCSGAQVLNCNITVDMHSTGTETGDSDCPISHTRTAILYGCSNAIVISSTLKATCNSTSNDHASDQNSYVTAIAQAFGLYSCSNAILSQSSIACSASATGDHYKASYIACALGSTAQYANCNFSASRIQDNGTNRWTSSYNFTCYK